MQYLNFKVNLKQVKKVFITVFFLFCALNTGNVQAQMVGTDIFLKGSFIEVGSCRIGSYGTCWDPPAGYHARPYVSLGFVADPAMDGWEVGTPDYFGDYFILGFPHEGWDIMIGSQWNRAWQMCGEFSAGGSSPLTLTGTNIAYEIEESKRIAVWQGSMGDLSILQRTILDTTKTFFVVEVTLKNVGLSTLSSIFYDRTVDPDVDVVFTNDYTTTNTIVYQPTEENTSCLVSAMGVEYPGISYLGLGTKDCRARAYILTETLMPFESLSNIYNGLAYYSTIDPGDTIVDDVGIGIIFDIGDLEPGDSTSFSYIYVLRAEDLDSAFSVFNIGWNVNGMELEEVDTIEICKGEEIEVNIIDGESTYEWGEWSPTTGLAYPSGLNNRITVQPETITYQVVGFDKTCRTYDTLRLTIIPIADTTILDEEICEGFYDFNGDTIDVSGSYIQHYSTLEGCDSVVILHLTVKPQAGVEVTAYATDICEGDSALFRVTNPTESTSYQWYRDGFPIEEARALSYMAPSIGGIYFVVGITTTGCTDTSEFILLTVHPAATVVLEETEFGSLCIGDTVALSVDAQPGYLYYWSPEKSFRYTTGGRVPRVKGVMLEEENVIEVTAVTEFGCTARDNMVIYAHPCCYIYIPTAFSPNGDGLNDDFNILLESGQKIVSFQIFDRYGSMVYNNNDIRKGWNGRVENRGEEVAQSVYYYRVLYSCTDGRNYEAKGDVSLFR